VLINSRNEADLRTVGALVSVTIPSPPIGFELLAAGANPGRGRCAVRLVMAKPARVDAEVVDVLGRTVAVLLEGQPREAGSQTLEWGGRDQRGADAPVGVYFIRVRAGGDVAVRKAVLMR